MCSVLRGDFAHLGDMIGRWLAKSVPSIFRLMILTDRIFIFLCLAATLAVTFQTLRNIVFSIRRPSSSNAIDDAVHHERVRGKGANALLSDLLMVMLHIGGWQAQ